MTIINKIFMLTVLMSVAGSIVSAVVLKTRNVVYKYTSADFMVQIYKIAMISFILPLYILISIDNIITDFVLYDPVVIVREGSFKETAYEIMGRIHFADVISVIWFVGFIIYLSIHISAYARIRENIKNSSVESDDSLWQEVFRAICMKRNIKTGKIKLLFCTEIGQPCATGMVRKIILIPENLRDRLKRKDISMILEHELTHIQKNDMATKILMFTLSSLNWFNPLMQRLRHGLYDWIECSCDERVTEGWSRENCLDYARLLVSLNEEQCKYDWCVSAMFLNNSKNLEILKRRIEIFMKKENKANGAAKVAVLTGMLATTICATAIAKEADTAVESIFSRSAAVFRDIDLMEAEFDENGVDMDEYLYVDFGDESMTNAVEYVPDKGTEDYLLSKEGKIEEIPVENTEIEPQHTHTYVDKNYKEHKKHSDGSCTVTTYAAKVCSSCGKVVKGSVISEMEYAKCPH